MHRPRHRPEIKGLVRERLIGVLLGDGTVVNHKQNRNNKFQVANINYEFLNWFDEKMGWLSTGVRTFRTAEKQAKSSAENGLKGASGDSQNYSTLYKVGTRVHPTFNEWRDWFYPNGQKVYPDDLELTAEMARMWYVTDGLVNRTQIGISGGTIELEKIASVFSEKGYEPSRIQAESSTVFFSGKTSQQLLGWMGDPPPGFDYKWQLD